MFACALRKRTQDIIIIEIYSNYTNKKCGAHFACPIKVLYLTLILEIPKIIQS